MRVLVTGAGGNLGRVVLPALREAGHEPVGLDSRELDLEAETMRGDVRDADAVARALRGVDAVVHAAALHGVHLRRFPAREFWSVNAGGTFTVYDCARAAGIRRVVLASTMGVYGETKLLCEELAAYHARAHGMTSVALRFGMYVPESFVRYGLRLLFGGVDDRDVAQATLLALAHEPDGGFDAFDIMAPTPFRRDDAEAMAQDPEALIERHWPGSLDLFAERGVDVRPLIWGETLWPIDKARERLGYRPRHGFGEFLTALRAGDESAYPFAALPQWGM